MNNYYQSNPTDNSQYYNESAQTNLKNGLLVTKDLNYTFNRQPNLNNFNSSPVNFYYENYSDTLNQQPLFSNSIFNSSPSNSFNCSFNRNQFNQTSRRFFYRNSIFNSSNRSNLSPVQSTNSSSINSNWNSSEKNLFNMISDDPDHNENLLYSTLSPNLLPSQQQSRQHSLIKRSSVIGSNETNLIPKLKPKFKNGKFSNSYEGTWQDKTFFGLLKFIFSPSSLGLPSKKSLYFYILKSSYIKIFISLINSR